MIPKQSFHHQGYSERKYLQVDVQYLQALKFQTKTYYCHAYLKLEILA